MWVRLPPSCPRCLFFLALKAISCEIPAIHTEGGGGSSADPQEPLAGYQTTICRAGAACHTMFAIFFFNSAANAIIVFGSLNPAKMTFPDENMRAVPPSPR